jgi:gas vesicle protein
MNQVLLGIGVGAFLILVAYCVYLILDLRKTSAALRESTERDLSPALRQLTTTLGHVNKIGGEAAAVAGTARRITDTVADVERLVRAFTDRQGEGLGEAAQAHLSGLKAGLISAVEALLKSRAREEGGVTMKEDTGTVITRGRSVIAPFVMGGIIGAGIALLLAPKSGRELRKDVRDLASDAKEKLAVAVERGKDLLEEGKSAVAEAIEAGRTAYSHEKEKHLKAV